MLRPFYLYGILSYYVSFSKVRCSGISVLKKFAKRGREGTNVISK